MLTGKKNVQQLKDQALAEQKRQADLERVRKLVNSGRELITKKDLTGAGKALAEAQALAPRDPAVVAALGELEAARKPSPAETARLKQRQEDYKLAMDAAKDALTKKNYQGAINAAKEALRLMPGDAAATALSQQAQTALTNNQAEEMRKKADFTRLVSSARTAVAGKRYADAIRNYTDALKLYPNDAEAKKGLADAQQLAKPPPSGTTKPK